MASESPSSGSGCLILIFLVIAGFFAYIIMNDQSPQPGTTAARTTRGQVTTARPTAVATSTSPLDALWGSDPQATTSPRSFFGLPAQPSARRPTRQPTRQPTPRCYSVRSRSNLRAGPSIEYARIASVDPGACLRLQGTNPAATWFWIYHNNGLDGIAWIRADLIRGSTAAVPREDPPVPIPQLPRRTVPATARPAATPTFVHGCNPGGCTGEPRQCSLIIKGNISYETGERIYHMPGQEYYDNTNIEPDYGERWFCSEQEAISAGWRKSQR